MKSEELLIDDTHEREEIKVITKISNHAYIVIFNYSEVERGCQLPTLAVSSR